MLVVFVRGVIARTLCFAGTLFAVWASNALFATFFCLDKVHNDTHSNGYCNHYNDDVFQFHSMYPFINLVSSKLVRLLLVC